MLFFASKQRICCPAPWKLTSFLPLLLIAASAWIGQLPTLRAQNGGGQPPVGQGQIAPQKSYPPREYYYGLELLRAGAMREAGQALQAAARRGKRLPNGQWIDAIPAHAMWGEALYQQGDLGGAHTQFDAVLSLVVQHEATLASIQWPTPWPAAGTPRIDIPPWAAGVRGRVVADIDRAMVLFGDLNPQQVLRQGGVYIQPQNVRIDAQEVLRCIAWSAFRRQEILGTVAENDPLVQSAREAVQRITTAAIPTSTPLWKTIEGLLNLDDDGGKAAINLLQSSIKSNGLFHPLSPISGAALCRVQLGNSDWEAAEASLAGLYETTIWYGQFEVLAELLRLRAGLTASPSPPPIAPQAIAIAETTGRDSNLVAVAARLLAAEDALNHGELALANTALTAAKLVIRNRDTTLPRYAAWSAWVTASLAAQSGNQLEVVAGQRDVVQFATRTLAVPSFYQRAKLLTALAGDQAGAAEAKLAQLIVPPTSGQWACDPVDALAQTISGDIEIRQRLLARAIQNQQNDRIVPLADNLLAARFRAGLPCGGRPLDLRWLLAGPADALDNQGAQQRQQLVRRFPQLADAPRQIDLVGQSLTQADLATADTGQQKEQLLAWTKLAQQMNAAEIQVLAAAYRRLEIPPVFPGSLQSDTLAKRIPADTAVLLLLTESPRWTAVLITRNETRSWQITGGPRLTQRLNRWIASLGVGRKRAGQSQLPDDDQWRDEGTELRELLLPASEVDLTRFAQTVIVPSGPLWYVPFAALPSGDRDSPLLREQVTLTYCPLPSLVRFQRSDTAFSQRTGFVGGRFFAPRDAEAEKAELDSIVETRPDSVNLSTHCQQVSLALTRTQLRNLWLASVIRPANNPLDTNLLAGSDAKPTGGIGPGNTLADCLRLPIAAPETILLPGFSGNLGGNGNELFMLSTALYAMGSQQFVISRWPVGGQSTATLLREAIGELGNAPLRDVWQRAVNRLRTQQVDPDLEPLLSSGDRQQPNLTGDQPLFWSGYMVFE